jgi:hypothetical protein
MKKLIAQLNRPAETLNVLKEVLKMLNLIAETADTVKRKRIPTLKRIICTFELDCDDKTMTCTSAIIEGMPYKLSKLKEKIIEEKAKIKPVTLEEAGLKRQDQPMTIKIGGPP